MRVHTVILAQTGFLTGGRKKSFLDLSEDEQTVQLEEAYARAAVATIRAGALCLIMALSGACVVWLCFAWLFACYQGISAVISFLSHQNSST